MTNSLVGLVDIESTRWDKISAFMKLTFWTVYFLNSKRKIINKIISGSAKHDGTKRNY